MLLTKQLLRMDNANTYLQFSEEIFHQIIYIFSRSSFIENKKLWCPMSEQSNASKTDAAGCA